MNFIVFMFDTMRPDHLGCYGNNWIKTPNFDRFSQEATVFERAYAASFPTIPNRTDLFTGRYGEPLHPWVPLAHKQRTLPWVMGEKGYVTQLINDTPHLINRGTGFDAPFHAWWMIRGNEVDRYRTDCAKLELDFPREKMMGDLAELAYSQYLRNTLGRRLEREHFAPQVLRAATDWLEQNYCHKNFFLWVDSFDPHEPWDPPKHYLDLYDPGFKRGVPPNFFNNPAITPRERRHLRARYAAMITMIDTWFGRVLERIDTLGLADNTAVIVTSDHGTGLADHGRLSKFSPTYEEVGRIVWLMRIPKLAQGKRIRALVQPPDLMPTILNLAGAPIPDYVQGKSLVPLLKGSKTKLRDFAVTGPAPTTSAPVPITVTTSRWSLLLAPGRKELYDLTKDPGQKRNVFRGHPRVAQRLHAKMVKLLEELDAPEWAVEAYRTGEKREAPGAQSLARARKGKSKELEMRRVVFSGWGGPHAR